jgi:hypothetical protein
LGNFSSCDAFGQQAIRFVPLDPNGSSYHNVTFQITPNHSLASLKIEVVIGLDAAALNSLLDQFLRASQFPNWLEYLKTRHEIILDEKYYKVPVIEKNDQDLIKTFQDEVKKLRYENNELTNKLKKFKLEMSRILKDIPKQKI